MFTSRKLFIRISINAKFKIHVLLGIPLYDVLFTYMHAWMAVIGQKGKKFAYFVSLYNLKLSFLITMLRNCLDLFNQQ